MATPPDFSVGGVLTAGQMNQVGLWKIAQATLTGTAVNITSCFSSSFDSYRIIVSDLANGVTAAYLQFQLLTGTTPANAANTYKWQRLNANNAVVAGVSGSDTQGAIAAFGTYGANAVSIDIYDPAKSLYTKATSVGMYDQNSGAPVTEQFAVAHLVATAYDGIRLMPSGGNFYSGKVTVYGYRL